MSESECEGVVHVALLPSAGMGHLTPFLRLASLLLHHNCKLTLITPQPTVSISEAQLLARFHSAYPQVNQLHFHLQRPNSNSNKVDPFLLGFQTYRASAHLLTPLLSSLSPPLSALISDISLISSLVPITQALSLPNYILSISSAYMFSFFSHFSSVAPSLPSLDAVEIPGVSPTLPTSSIPPALMDPNGMFRNIFMEDSPKVTKLHGVIVNTFEALEADTLEALNGGKVVRGMPPVLALGPFVPCEFEKRGEESGGPLKWLDEQESGSVVFVCFGSRTAMGRDQIREIGEGLIRSGCKFLWVVKDKILDREEQEGLEGVLGAEIVDRVRKNGFVTNEWVDQNGILGHKAVGGFLNHVGWNSVTEAAWHGVPLLGWPLNGDQRICAEVVVKSGWGLWNRNWSWAGEQRVVKAEEIGKAIRDMMNNESLRIKASQVKEAARKAMDVGGDSRVTIQKLIQQWKNNVINI